MRNNINKNSGFTLIETIIAIFLLMATITALMELVSRTLISTRGQRLEVTAQYLAQEGLEYVRNNRDSALNGGATWYTPASTDFVQLGPGPCPVVGKKTPSLCPCIYAAGNPGACTVDPLTDQIAACPSGGSCPALIKVDVSGKQILCTPGAGCPGTNTTVGATTFVRSIRLTPSSSNVDELFVDVTVNWVDTGGVNKTKVINSSLLNW